METRYSNKKISKTISFRIDEETLKKIESLAIREGVSRSELIRRAISLYISKELRRIENNANNLQM